MTTKTNTIHIKDITTPKQAIKAFQQVDLERLQASGLKTSFVFYSS